MQLTNRPRSRRWHCNRYRSNNVVVSAVVRLFVGGHLSPELHDMRLVSGVRRIYRDLWELLSGDNVT